MKSMWNVNAFAGFLRHACDAMVLIMIDISILRWIWLHNQSTELYAPSTYHRQLNQKFIFDLYCTEAIDLHRIGQFNGDMAFMHFGKA
mgnify:CR=1 FL=1